MRLAFLSPAILKSIYDEEVPIFPPSSLGREGLARLLGDALQRPAF